MPCSTGIIPGLTGTGRSLGPTGHLLGGLWALPERQAALLCGRKYFSALASLAESPGSLPVEFLLTAGSPAHRDAVPDMNLKPRQ